MSTPDTPEPEKIPQPHGGALLPKGKRGNKGGGRPKKQWKSFCKEVLEDPGTQKAIKRAAKEGGRGYAALLALLAKYGIGEPPKTVRVSVVDRLHTLSDAELAALEQATDEELEALLDDGDE